LRALKDGAIDIPGLAVEEAVPDLAGSADVVDLSFYGGIEIGPEGTMTPWPRGARVTDAGWAPSSDALAEAIRHAADDLGDRRFAITTGIATDDDEWRAAWMAEVSAVAAEAIADGIGIDTLSARSAWDAPSPAPRWGVCDRGGTPKPSLEALALAE
jgi:hypothetical protein